MAVDQKIEFFTYELFNHLLLNSNIISVPFTRKGDDETPVESELNDNIVNAVVLRMILFAELYRKIIFSKYWYFRYCKGDFYTFLEKHFPNKDFPYKSVMDKILALCAFVFKVCEYSYSQDNCLFMSECYLFCAMYFDQELKTEFYKESGWIGLNRICHSYSSPFVFIWECSYPMEQLCENNSDTLTAQKIMKNIDKFRQFIKHTPLFEDETTPHWVNHCLDDMHYTHPQPTKDSEKNHLSVEGLEALVTDLKHYCDPLASSLIGFDVPCKMAKAKRWDAKLFLNDYLKNQATMFDPEPIEAEFLFLEPFLHLAQAYPSSKSQLVSQNCNSEVGDSETFSQLLPELSTLENMNKDVNTYLEILDENLKHLEQDHDPYSFYDLEISTSGSALNGSYNVMKGSPTEKSPDKKEASSTIQNLSPKISPEGIRSGSSITSKALTFEKDTVTNKCSKLSSLLPDGIKINPSYDGDLRDKKTRRSFRKKNSPIVQILGAKFSPEKLFKGSPSNPKASENKDIDQETGSLPNFKLPPSFNLSSSLMSKGRLDGKDFSSNIQVSETKSSPRTTTASPNIPKSFETKKDKDQVIDSLSNLNINSFSPDDNIISPNCFHNSGAKERRSGRKENTPTVQSANRKLSQARMLFSTQNTPPNTTVMKSGECKDTDEVISHDNSTNFTLHSQDSSLNVSRASEVEKEKLIPKVMESKSKPHPVVFPHNLPQSTSSSKEYTNSVKEQKVFHYLSPTDMEDYEKDPILSASDIALLQAKVRQKAVAVDELIKKTATKPQTETSQPQQGLEDQSVPKTCAKKNKKKSKKTKKSLRKTRRDILDETEEYAQDVLRMTLVMGNKVNLMMIKPTLKYYKDIEKSNEKE